MDDKFFDSQAKTKEELGRALRVRTDYCYYMNCTVKDCANWVYSVILQEEIRQLRLQLKEKEINAEQDRSLRNKVNILEKLPFERAGLDLWGWKVLPVATIFAHL